MKTRSITLSIGIPAYNEEANIRYLIDSILKQEQKSYVLEKVIVISDGSTDKTNRIIKDIRKQHRVVSLIADRKRKGKTARLNELFLMNESDILLVLDADLALNEPDVIEKMIPYFKSKKIAIVGLSMKAIDSKKFIGMLINFWEEIWYEVRKNINNYNSVHNIRGGAFAVRKSLVKKVNIPPHIQEVARYLYFLANYRKFDFSFAEDAVVLYRTPDNFSEYVSVLSRGDNAETELFEDIFGKNIYEEYTISKNAKIKALTKAVIKNPFLTITTIMFVYFANFWASRKNSLERPGIWRVTPSTKKAISTTF